MRAALISLWRNRVKSHSRRYRPRLEELEPRRLMSADVLTNHNDNARTGADLTETLLTPTDVNTTDFGKQFSFSVDGQVYAQPLYMSNVSIAGRGPHNVVLVATEHDSLYAFDADSNQGPNAAPLWQISFINPAAGVTTVSSSDVGCDQITPEIGITATPVIDPTTGTLYVVAMTKEVVGSTTNYVQRLHALDISSGAEKFGGPVVIQASVPGTGDGGTTVTFIPKNYKERPGLLLLNGVVYTAWSSHCDAGVYHGWIMGYDALTLKQVSVFNDTPNGSQASVWASGAGPAADAAGNIYFMTGNGTFDANIGGPDYGDSVLRLSTAGGKLTVADYFAPSNQATLNAQDADLGSGGVLLLPPTVGSLAHPNLLVGAGKGGTLYLIDQNNLGQFHAGGDQVVQEGSASQEFGMPAYFNNQVYIGGVGDALKAYHIANGMLSFMGQTATIFGYPGTTPSISANGASNGIVWSIELGNTAILHAYDALNLGHELYNSNQAGSRDQLDAGIKFSVPTIANGKVYVGTGSTLTVFGLFGTSRVVTAPGAGGGPDIRIFDAGTGALVHEFGAYDSRFRGGVRVATGDFNGDGVLDVVTAPGPGGGPDIRVFDGNTGQLIGEFMAYDPRFLGGLYVAVGDVNGDGTPDIITAPDQGGGPDIRVFDGKTGNLIQEFLAYDSRFLGGVRIAAADVTGDRKADIITAPGPSGGPDVRVFEGLTSAQIGGFYAYTTAFTGGLYVAAGDLLGTGKADIVTAPDQNGGPDVRVFDASTMAMIREFGAYDSTFRGGVRVGIVADVNGDGKVDIVTAPGINGGPDIRVFDGTTTALLDEFYAYDPHFVGGVYVGGR